jgi:uncharacterized protein (DUF4415 family)
MIKELEALEALPDDQIDTSDIPERIGKRQKYIGLFYRPAKKSVTIRLDADLLAWFKAQGRGYQSKMNRILREYFASHR